MTSNHLPPANLAGGHLKGVRIEKIWLRARSNSARENSARGYFEAIHFEKHVRGDCSTKLSEGVVKARLNSASLQVAVFQTRMNILGCPYIFIYIYIYIYIYVCVCVRFVSS